ncbi:MAG: hypothetical protein KAZ27_18445, partial [Saprospiraceae bacterium]|nr:hypothetical protein [Saprospiraceae bacterium]
SFKMGPMALKTFNPLTAEEALKPGPGVNIVGAMGCPTAQISASGAPGADAPKRSCSWRMGHLLHQLPISHPVPITTR